MRVLLITYHFPPDAEVGAVRPYQMARLLPEYGIEPWVLTVRPEFAERRDERLVPEGVPPSRIIRTDVGQTRRVRMIHLASSLKNSLRSQPTTAGVVPNAPDVPSEGHEGWLRATPFRRWMLAWLWFPDAMLGWRGPAIAAGDELLRREKFDAILSSSPPRVVHLIARTLANRHNLPWVMDLRDPWYKDTDEINSKTLDAAYNRLYVPLMKRADKIVWNTHRLLDLMNVEWPAAASKSVAIPNGCNVSAKPATVSNGVSARFTIGHYGSVYSKRDPGPFLRGLRLWLDRAKANGETRDVQVRFVGPEFGSTPEHIEALGLSPIVSLNPPVGRDRVPQLMSEDYALLLLANKQPLQVPGKLYEYLAARRRILATAEGEGSTFDLLSRAEGACTAVTEEDVVRALDRFWNDFKAGKPAEVSNDTLLAECSYDRRAADMADAIRSVVQARSR
jgi:hypothetical protein